jgi:hypothetical protein
MENSLNRKFEIADEGNYLRIEPLTRLQFGSDIKSDRNWIDTRISVKAGGFIGQYTMLISTGDFEYFRRDLAGLYDDLAGKIKFSPLEGQLTLDITGDGIGHFRVSGEARDNAGSGNQLYFELNFDQTNIKELVSQLEGITRDFPVVGLG